MKPILFNTEMVRAILEGRKTVTRRLVKGQDPMVKAPYQPGDILWVRETFRVDYLSNTPGAGRIRYKADGAYSDFGFAVERYDMMRRAQRKPGWRPSENMPREAARIFLRVTAVRAERLQEITPEDVEREGIRWVNNPLIRLNLTTLASESKRRFAPLWDSTIKPADLPRCGWEANPWVWVIEFVRISKKAADLLTTDPVHAAGGCYCRECRWGQVDGIGVMHCHKFHIHHRKADGFCDGGKLREEQNYE